MAEPYVDPNLDLEDLPREEIDAIRLALQAEARTSAANLSDEKLERLCACYRVLRRKSSGPPKKAKPATAIPSLGDLLG